MGVQKAGFRGVDEVIGQEETAGFAIGFGQLADWKSISAGKLSQGSKGILELVPHGFLHVPYRRFGHRQKVRQGEGGSAAKPKDDRPKDDEPTDDRPKDDAEMLHGVIGF
jgi:hypothetical protein